MAGLVDRLRELLAEAEPPEDAVAALDIAYQQRLASLHEVRHELEDVASARRRLAVARGLADPASAAAEESRDAQFAAQELALDRLSAVLRSQVEDFRAERDRIRLLPDPVLMAHEARAALSRWQQGARTLLRDAADDYPEPSGFVADADAPDTFEQPPGGVRR